MIHVRMRYRRAGGHVHIRVFTGVDTDHLGLTGELMERVEEWEGFRRALPTVDFVCDDDDADRETYDPPLTGVFVTTHDFDAGQGETMQLLPHGHVLTLGAGMELAYEQRHGNGTVQLTLRRRANDAEEAS